MPFALIRRLVLPVLLGLAAAAALIWLAKWPGQPSSSVVISDPPAILREIQRLQQLVTVKYAVQKVIGLEEEKFPVGAERLLLIVQANVTAGIEMGELNENALRVMDSEVFVNLPEPKILQVAFDENETRVWDRSVTWWTPWVPYNKDLERQARVAAIESIRKSAIEMGILDQAGRNAEMTLRAFLIALGFQKVTFASPS